MTSRPTHEGSGYRAVFKWKTDDFALSFSFKDVISNALAGILILIYEPFRRQDRISVTALEGIVVRIDLRYTTLQTDDQQILIPNSTLFTNPIIVQSEQKPKTPRLGSE